MKGLYYFVKKPYQFSQSKPVFDRLGGEIITCTHWLKTYLYFLLRYGPFRVRIMGRGFRRLDRAAKGIILCHSGEHIIPQGKNYRRVFVYHGTCDTVYKAEGPEGKLLSHWFEYYFLTGDKDLYKLKRYTYDRENLDGKTLKIGMFQSDPIIAMNYDRERILRRYGIRTRGKRVVLYAPTWSWGGGTLEACFEKFATRIPSEYVLIVRPHANDIRNIRSIVKWQKRHRVRDLYIFPKPSQSIMHLIFIADVLIGDNSAVNYDFALTGRPLVLVKSDHHEHLFVPPDEYNIKLCCPIYDVEKDDILEKIDDAMTNPVYKERLNALVERSFYFNDGRAVDRECSFIVDRLSEMGIAKREEMLRRYGKRFRYTESYW